MEIKNNVFVVTGAARGLGFEIAKDLARFGGKLALIDMDEKGLEQSAAALSEHGVEIHTYSLNVANEAEVIEAFNRIQKDFGQINGLVNNAGIFPDPSPGDAASSILAADLEVVRRALETNTLAALRSAARRKPGVLSARWRRLLRPLRHRICPATFTSGRQKFTAA